MPCGLQGGSLLPRGRQTISGRSGPGAAAAAWQRSTKVSRSEALLTFSGRCSEICFLLLLASSKCLDPIAGRAHAAAALEGLPALQAKQQAPDAISNSNFGC